jgi:hypothetical protein
LAAKRERNAPQPGFEYGWVRGTGSAAFIVGSILVGSAVSSWGLAIILWLQAALLMMVPLATRLVPEESNRSPSQQAITKDSVAALLRMPVFRRVVLVAALILGSHAMHDTFAVIRWSAADISPRTASLLWSASLAAEVIVFFVIGPSLVRVLGPAGAIALAGLAGAVRWGIAAVTADTTALLFTQPLHGLTFALLHLACMRLLAEHVPQQLAATAQAIYGTVGVGLATAALTLVSGWSRQGPVPSSPVFCAWPRARRLGCSDWHATRDAVISHQQPRAAENRRDTAGARQPTHPMPPAASASRILDGNNRSMARAGRGMLNRKPCISEQPSQRILSSCACVSTLRGCRHSQAFGKRRNRPHDVERARAFSNVLDEGAVNFDFIERETLQIAERGIAGAEVVHGDTHAELPQPIERSKRRLAVLQQDRFGDLGSAEWAKVRKWQALRQSPAGGRR